MLCHHTCDLSWAQPVAQLGAHTSPFTGESLYDLVSCGRGYARQTWFNCQDARRGSPKVLLRRDVVWRGPFRSTARALRRISAGLPAYARKRKRKCARSASLGDWEEARRLYTRPCVEHVRAGTPAGSNAGTNAAPRQTVCHGPNFIIQKAIWLVLSLQQFATLT